MNQEASYDHLDSSNLKKKNYWNDDGNKYFIK